jgi:hypothetical protein
MSSFEFGRDLDRGSISNVDVWDYEGRLYEVVMASDLARDGMALELTDLGSPASAPVLEAFWHDDGGGFEFITQGAAALPFEVVERFVAAARNRLPPVSEQRDG